MSNLYLIPNSKNEQGGDFYNVYQNEGPRLNMLDPDSIDDPTLKKVGGIILRKGQRIDTLTTYAPGKDGVLIETEDYEDLLVAIDVVENDLNAIKARIRKRGGK